MSEKLYEKIAVLGGLNPVSVSPGVANTDFVDMSKFDKVLFVVNAGVLGASATLDFAVRGDVASGGAYATTITGKAITQLTKVGSQDNKLVLVEVAAIEVLSQGLRYIRGLVTVGTAASIVQVIILGAMSHYEPVTLYEPATIVQIVD